MREFATKHRRQLRWTGWGDRVPWQRLPCVGGLARCAATADDPRAGDRRRRRWLHRHRAVFAGTRPQPRGTLPRNCVGSHRRSGSADPPSRVQADGHDLHVDGGPDGVQRHERRRVHTGDILYRDGGAIALQCALGDGQSAVPERGLLACHGQSVRDLLQRLWQLLFARFGRGAVAKLRRNWGFEKRALPEMFE